MAGVKKILVPLKKDELDINKIIEVMPYVMSVFAENSAKIKENYETYLNKHSAIEGKVRRYEDDSDINHKVAIPHLYSLVNFKSGYVLGNPKEYSQTEDSQSETIKYLNKYAKDVNLRSKDKEVAVWVYATGVGYYFIEPKENLNDIDLEFQSPFNVYVRKAHTCAKIYSAYNGEEELFDILVTDIQRGDDDIKLISVYTPDNYYEIETEDLEDFSFDSKTTVPRPVYKMLPLVEKYANSDRVGIVEIGLDLQDALDKISSSSLDNIEELVNELLIFRNTNLGKTEEEKRQTLVNAKKNGALIINDMSPDRKSGVESLTQKLLHSDVFILANSLKQELYDSCGVPIPSSNMHGNDTTKSASQVANGWENAYNRILDDINSFMDADYKFLERVLFICNKVATSKVVGLNHSEIEVKYNPNMTDNMLSKSQSYGTYISAGVQPEIAIQWCRLSNDPITQGKMIKENMEKVAKDKIELEKAKKGIANISEENEYNNTKGISGETL